MTRPPGPPAAPARLIRLLAWLPAAGGLALFAGLGALWAEGGLARVAAWSLAKDLVPYGAVVVVLTALVVALVRRRAGAPLVAAGLVGLVGSLPLVGIFAGVPLAYPADIETTRPHLQVRLPGDAAYVVGWGGDTVEDNYHAAFPDQRWAYDLLVAPYGLMTADLDAYGCWGTPVLAPLAGTVAMVQTGVADSPPWTAKQQHQNPLQPRGNFVAIEGPDATFLIVAHLQHGSVAVEPGEVVAEGQLLGRCGNSGNTSEPHIHLHHQRQDPREFPHGFAEGLPLFFRDHDGPPLPTGGITLDPATGRPRSRGPVVRHRGAGAAD